MARRPTLRHIDPAGSPRWFVRVYAAFAATRIVKFVSRHVSWKLDPLLLRLTRGRLATTLVFPAAVLEARGARTGALRHNAIVYFHDGDQVMIAASNAGSSRHPGWYYNLLAHPDVTFGGTPMRRRWSRTKTSASGSGRSQSTSSPPSTGTSVSALVVGTRRSVATRGLGGRQRVGDERW